jgi:hypothetical protein
MIQLAPLMASMACLFKISTSSARSSDFADGARTSTRSLRHGGPSIDAITKLEGCIPALQIPRLVLMLKGMLESSCGLQLLLTQLEDSLGFRASIDFAAADGNPVLIEALTCAQNSATPQRPPAPVARAAPPIMDIIGMIGGVAGVSLELPDLSAMGLISAGGDVTRRSVGEAGRRQPEDRGESLGLRST